MARLSPSSCINDVLSLHLLVEVLARLPLRHVFRCKSVCKLWLSCIQDIDSCFVDRFVQWNEEKNDNLQQKQMIHVVMDGREMLLVQPSCSISVTASQVSLDFLPFFDELVHHAKGILNFRHFVLASNNGLLVCSPNTSRYAEYYICNPLTRQWLALPLPPRSKKHDIGVGFIYNSFCNVDDSIVNDRFSVKLVRLLLTHQKWDNDPPPILAEVFSSRTGWSTLEIPDDIRSVIRFNCPPVPYKGKIHWLLRDCDFMIYDPERKELLRESVANGPPAEELYIRQGTTKHLVGFDRLSICQGSFWIGQALNGRMRVFRLTNGVWGLEHDVDACNEMHWSSSSVQQKLVTGARNGANSGYGVPFLQFWTMHPSDPMIAYVSVDTSFLKCNFQDRTMEVLSEQQGLWSNGVMLSLPPWPTPLPAV